MTRRTDPIFEVFDAEDAFRTTPSEEEMQQIWDLIGPLMERYLRLRPIWQVAAGAFIEGFETGVLKRLMWYGELTRRTLRQPSRFKMSFVKTTF